VLQLRLTIQQTVELALTGGITETIFPEAEVLLWASTKYQKALEYIGRRKDMDRYESLMDFLFCELHPEFRAGCFKYYLDRRRPLRKILTEQERYFYACRLVLALETALALWEQDLVQSWGHYAKVVDHLAA
jgi:hypothetical protein